MLILFYFFSIPMNGALVVDGVLDESIWQGEKIPIQIETYPAENQPAAVKAEMMVRFDETHIYIGIYAEDKQIGQLRSHMRKRDQIDDDDYVGVMLDPFGNGERGYGFFVNPFGIQMDYIQDDVNKRNDRSWDGIWKASAKIGSNGYSVEMKIPFHQFRYPDVPKVQDWRIDGIRIYPRSQRHEIRSQAIDRNVDGYLNQIGTLRNVPVPNSKTHIQVIPTSTYRYLDSPLGSKNDPDMGATLKWGITSDLTFDAALYPDFSQVEADDAQIDFNQPFALFLDERRPFFLEGQEDVLTANNLFYSRIMVQPTFASKLWSKKDNHTFGIMAMEDEYTQFIRPGLERSETQSLEEKSQNGLIRYRYNMGSRSHVGILSTYRAADHYQSSMQSVDGRWQINPSNAVLYQTSFSQTKDGLDQNGHSQDLAYQHRSREWAVDATWQSFSPEFRADLGYLPKVGYQKGSTKVSKTWWTNDAFIKRWILSSSFERQNRYQSGFFSDLATLSGSIDLPSQSGLTLNWKAGQEAFRDVQYDISEQSISGYTRPSDSFMVHAFLAQGDTIDYSGQRQAEFVRFSPGFHTNPGKRVEANLHYSYFRLKSDLRTYVAHVPNLYVYVQATPEWAVRVTSQLRKEKTESDLIDRKGKWGIQALLSYKWNPQTAIYFGYQKDLEQDPFDSFEEKGESVFAKASYAWIP